MTKHVISILTLVVVSSIAMLSLIYETRVAGHLTTFGYVVVVLTVTSFILGVASMLYAIKEKSLEKAEEHAKHIEHKGQLGRIETEIKANTRPLLPVAVFYTLRHEISDDATEKAFAGIKGFRDIKNEYLKLVGTVQLGGIGYNPIEATATKSHCVLEGVQLSNLVENHTGFGESAIRSPVSSSLEFFFPIDGSLPEQPSLELEKTFTSGKPVEVKRLELFDNVVFQDCFVKQWTAQTGSEQNWSVANLRNTRIRLRLNFMGELNPVYLHNFQLFFGPLSSMHGIHFPLELLANAEYKKDPSPLLHAENELAAKFFSSYLLEYECNLSEPIISEHFVKVVAQ
jgi:hypothetical protein